MEARIGLNVHITISDIKWVRVKLIYAPLLRLDIFSPLLYRIKIKYLNLFRIFENY